MRRLRGLFGDSLMIGPKLTEWGWTVVKKERQLREYAIADDANLERVPNDFGWGPRSNRKKIRPFQRADIRFMATANVLNANQPGSGKTVETILSMYEADIMHGFHLIVAPKASLENVWTREIGEVYESIFGEQPMVLTGITVEERREAILEAKDLYDGGYSFWLVINPALIRMERVHMLDGELVTVPMKHLSAMEQMRVKEITRNTLDLDLLLSIDWTSITVDEFHLMGLSNPKTLGAKGVEQIAKETNPIRRHVLSGTPMGGKPVKLWGPLHFIDPNKYTSRWTWATLWLEVRKNEYGSTIEGIRPGLEEDFFISLHPHLVRRTKREVLPGLPPKTPIDVWCDMTSMQAEQYRVFQRDAEWRLDEKEEAGRLTATNILAEYTRLKQFADAYCDVIQLSSSDGGEEMPKLKVKQTNESGKLEQLVAKLSEEGVFDSDARAPALIFSQFNPMVEMVAAELAARKIATTIITGKTKDVAAIARSFQAGKGPQVLVLNTKMGTAQDLSYADSVHLLDETWVPDDQEQASDRAHRGDALTMAKDEVRVYYYRTTATIEEMIQNIVAGKSLNNKVILDLRRQMIKEAAK